MGLRLRKSINLGGGFRINISKSGIGYSWGSLGYRHTYSPNGSQRKTYSIPGTGISWVENAGRKNNNEKLNYDQNTKLITGETKYFNNINISDVGDNDEIIKQIRKLRIIDILAKICLLSVFLIPVGIVLKLFMNYHSTITNISKKSAKATSNSFADNSAVENKYEKGDGKALFSERTRLINTIKSVLEKQTNENDTQLLKIETNDTKSSNITGNTATMFTDVCVQGNEEHTQPIPQMNFEPVKKEEHTAPNDNFEIHFDYEPLYQPADFVKDMKQFEHKEGKKAEFVPFMQYCAIPVKIDTKKLQKTK